MIKLKYRYREEQPILEDVDINQFFISQEKAFCQKVTNNAYFVIADSSGKLVAVYMDNVDPHEHIIRVLPEVTSFKWEE